MKPRISICIANYNGIDLIDACIASVRTQDCAAAVEIIVHDDASQDGSAAHIRTRHPDVTLIESAAKTSASASPTIAWPRLQRATICCC